METCIIIWTWSHHCILCLVLKVSFKTEILYLVFVESAVKQQKIRICLHMYFCFQTWSSFLQKLSVEVSCTSCFFLSNVTSDKSPVGWDTQKQFVYSLSCSHAINQISPNPGAPYLIPTFQCQLVKLAAFFRVDWELTNLWMVCMERFHTVEVHIVTFAFIDVDGILDKKARKWKIWFIVLILLTNQGLRRCYNEIYHTCSWHSVFHVEALLPWHNLLLVIKSDLEHLWSVMIVSHVCF